MCSGLERHSLILLAFEHWSNSGANFNFPASASGLGSTIDIVVPMKNDSQRPS